MTSLSIHFLKQHCFLQFLPSFNCDLSFYGNLNSANGLDFDGSLDSINNLVLTDLFDILCTQALISCSVFVNGRGFNGGSNYYNDLGFHNGLSSDSNVKPLFTILLYIYSSSFTYYFNICRANLGQVTTSK